MASSFTIAGDATADPSPDHNSSPSPSAAKAPDPPNWTTVGRHGRNSRPKLSPSHPSTPRIPPPPDADASLESLRRDFRREQQRRRTTSKIVADSYRQIFRHEIPGPTTLVLDSVVCVALGSLSGTVAPPTTCDGKAIIGGQAREVSMRQLVALEEWIALLRERGHALPAPGEIPSAEEDETDAADKKKSKSKKKTKTTFEAKVKDEDEAETKDEEDEEDIPTPFTTPSSTPLKGVKIIQDPCFNALDALFLQGLGYIVLPSHKEACSFTSKEHQRSDHAGSHMTTSTFFYAPHAPHTLVRADILPGPGPGVYVGNCIEGADGALADEDNDGDDKANERREDAAAWTVHQTRKKRRRGKAKAKDTDTGTGTEDGDVDVDVDDERGEAMTKKQLAQMARWKARRRTVAPSRGLKDGIEVAFMDTWVYVLEAEKEEKEEERQHAHVEEEVKEEEKGGEG